MLTPEQMEPYIKKYGKEKVDEALEYLNYKDASVMPKEESDEFPTIYIFRHGQTEDNGSMVFSGWRDPDLTEKGIKQAWILAEKMKDKKIHMLIASPQIRAIKTMEIAISLNEKAKNLEIIKDPRIKERSYGDWQGKSKLEAHLEDPEGSAEVRRSFDGIPPNGESVKMVCDRVADFCNEIIPLMKQEKINVAVSCHGNSIRGFRRYFENLSDEETAILETPLAKDYAAYVIRG